ncbi:N-terminal L-serine N(alpha)-acetyltransferase NatD Ecym_7256 [Eremothecium cymbalariae DBVPG|uniref:N-acetyltransferase domain-containing protein n=1 Tax=Eremothecium cymbalariae (strain CBS 270.75 / DBVPG 7215 / KCTC 17166 / NRRL Y-17582) TaxID=931890 RepID=G8JW85_ERECY|nr:hypothetical protein Ecym_7256 [Eremothecium cymbalariae DBVPG\
MEYPAEILALYINDAFPEQLACRNGCTLSRDIIITDRLSVAARQKFAKQLTAIIERTLGCFYDVHAHLLYPRLTRSRPWQAHKRAELQGLGTCHVLYRKENPGGAIAGFVSLLFCDEPHWPAGNGSRAAASTAERERGPSGRSAEPAFEETPPPPPCKVVYVMEIHVSPSFQNQGLGSCMLLCARQLVQHMQPSFPQLKGLELTVFTGNRQALALYRRQGFKTATNTEFFLSNSELTVMYCSI